MFNFQNAKVQKEKFTRETSGIPRGQSFEFKYRPILSSKGKKAAEEAGEEFVPTLTHQFEISKVKFKEFELGSHAAAWLNDYDKKGKVIGVAMVVTSEDDENANTLKGSRGENKMLSFTHEKLEINLAEAGLIQVPVDENDEKIIGKNQRLSFEYVADIESLEVAEGEEYTIVDKGEGLPVYAVVPYTGNEGDEDDEVEEEVEEVEEVE